MTITDHGTDANRQVSERSAEPVSGTHHPNAAPARGLNPLQREYLLKPLDPARVRNTQGQSHLEAWDIRRWLNRIFGIGGWSYTTTAELVREIEITMEDQKRANPQWTPKGSRWTVVYRAKVRLEVRDPNGTELAFFEEYAAGDSTNQPALGDAHDMAVKTAESQALKRCAVNLGDAFGLSLYANGTTQAVVQATLDHAPGTAAPVTGLDEQAAA